MSKIKCPRCNHTFDHEDEEAEIQCMDCGKINFDEVDNDDGDPLCAECADARTAGDILFLMREGHQGRLADAFRWGKTFSWSIVSQLIGEAKIYFSQGDLDNAMLCLRQAAEPKYNNIHDCKTKYDQAMGRAQA